MLYIEVVRKSWPLPLIILSLIGALLWSYLGVRSDDPTIPSQRSEKRLTKGEDSLDKMADVFGSETVAAQRSFNKGTSGSDLMDQDVISSIELDQLKPEAGEIVTNEGVSVGLDSPALAQPVIEAVTTPTPTIERTDSLFTSEELRELEALSRENSNSQVRGLGMRVPPSAPQVAVQQPTPRATSEPDKESLPRLRGQARGFVMLPLMQPEARQANEALVQTMLDAEIENLYLSTLVDGTFSSDFPYLESVVRRLNTGGRSLTLVLYLTNGPTMRDHDTTTIDAGFNKLEPVLFRNLIIYDRRTQDEFAAIVKQAAPIFALNRSRNPLNHNIAIVMLEDNLDAEAYRTMRSISSVNLPADVSLIRNPCLGCYRGNDDFSYGDKVESHSPGDIESKLGIGDGFSLDGVGYGYPDENPSTELSYQETLRLISVSAARGLRYFGLWRAPRQGITTNADTLPHPSTRQYEVSTSAQRELDIALLREGLIEK